jgi:hypothetical protein
MGNVRDYLQTDSAAGSAAELPKHMPLTNEQPQCRGANAEGGIVYRALRDAAD